MTAAASFSVPRLETERLLLRELRLADFDGYAAHLADPIATEFLDGVIDRRQAWRLFTSLTGMWMLTGAGWWAVELRATGEVVGIVGAFIRETTFALGAEADLELGWSIYQRFWRQGYAKEAAAAALEFGFAQGRRRAIAYVRPRNIASVGVCKAIGMHLEGEVDFYTFRSTRYAIERS